MMMEFLIFIGMMILLFYCFFGVKNNKKRQWFSKQDPRNFCIINAGANVISLWASEEELEFAIERGFLKNDLTIDLTGGVEDFDFQGLSNSDFIGLRLEQFGFFKNESWYEMHETKNYLSTQKGSLLAKTKNFLRDWRDASVLNDYDLARADMFFTEDGTGERVKKEYWEKVNRIRRAISLAYRWRNRKKAQEKLRQYKEMMERRERK